MARFDRLTVLTTMIDVGLVPLFYHDDVDVCKKVIHALAEGGARVVEFTNRGDQAMEVFKELVPYFAKAEPQVILGVGSIADAPTAGIAISYGANFVVGPMLNPEVAKVCNRRKIAYMPGCGTVSEISAAEELGCEICKVFPGTQVGGPGFIKAVTAPMPWTQADADGRRLAGGGEHQGLDQSGRRLRRYGQRDGPQGVARCRRLPQDHRSARQALQWIREARGQ
jgi:2-dehydro-3-deoxyphosphogluconate aldolase / (4S)-4-hydroxy-2-oxoglutarate aldolase